MADAKEDAEWSRTCYIVATVGSLFQKKSINPADIHPMWEPKGFSQSELEDRSERRRNKSRQGSNRGKP